MSTPQDQAHQTLTQSHQVAQQAAAGHSAALAKLMQSLQGMQAPAGAGAPQAAPSPADPDQDGDSDLPDPQQFVQQDPEQAAAYAEAIMQALAELLVNQGMAPQGAPISQAPAGPEVGGGAGPAY